MAKGKNYREFGIGEDIFKGSLWMCLKWIVESLIIKGRRNVDLYKERTCGKVGYVKAKSFDKL